jgi:hypothetical protein
LVFASTPLNNDVATIQGLVCVNLKASHFIEKIINLLLNAKKFEYFLI